MTAITQVFAPIAPGPAVGGQAFTAGSATTFTKPTRYIIASGAGNIIATTNDGSVLTIAVTAGQVVPLSVLSVASGGTASGVGLW